MYKYKNIFVSLSAIFVALAVWWIVNYLQIINPLFVPNLTSTFSRLGSLLTDLTTYRGLSLTIFRALSGLILAALVGIPLGLVLAKVPTLYRLTALPIEFLRAIPPSALFPLFILFFGIGDSSKTAVVFYACSLILLISSYYGALPNQEKMDRINMLRAFGANNFQIFFLSIVRDATPNISAGFRVCLSYSLALVVVIEMFLGANEGLGKMIYDYYLQYRIPEMYAAIIILGLTGFALNQIYRYFENKFVFWAPR